MTAVPMLLNESSSSVMSLASLATDVPVPPLTDRLGHDSGQAHRSYRLRLRRLRLLFVEATAQDVVCPSGGRGT